MKNNWVVTTYDKRDTSKTIESIGGSPIVYNNDDYESLAELWNYAIKTREEDIIIITQDDVIVHENTDQELMSALDDNILIATAWDENWEETKNRVNFFCFALDQRLIDKIGYFDEGFKGYYFEDTDMVYRMSLQGYTPKAVTPVIHNQNHTSSLHDRKENLHLNWVRYCLKWGGNTGHERFTIPFNGLSQDAAIDEFERHEPAWVKDITWQRI